MTQVFRPDGTVVPVTRVQAGPCVVTQVKHEGKDGVHAVQIGFGTQKIFRVPKAQKGHFKGITFGDKAVTVRYVRDFRVPQESPLQKGQVYTVQIFEPGEKVKVVGQSKGKGFQGVVKRHKFAGSLATHGHKDQLRMPGSIGSTGPQRVFKGIRMAGHMGELSQVFGSMKANFFAIGPSLSLYTGTPYGYTIEKEAIRQEVRAFSEDPAHSADQGETGADLTEAIFPQCPE